MIWDGQLLKKKPQNINRRRWHDEWSISCLGHNVMVMDVVARGSCSGCMITRRCMQGSQKSDNGLGVQILYLLVFCWVQWSSVPNASFVGRVKTRREQIHGLLRSSAGSSSAWWELSRYPFPCLSARAAALKITWVVHSFHPKFGGVLARHCKAELALLIKTHT